MGNTELKLEDKINGNPFLEKIDMSFIDREYGVDGVDYYRILDGISPEITAQIYDDLIPTNFNSDEHEEKTDFLGYFQKKPEFNMLYESLNIVAIHKNKFAGLLVGSAFHRSKTGYFGYLAVDETIRKKGIGSKLFRTGIHLMKNAAQNHGYDHENLAVFLCCEKTDSSINLDKGQDPHQRLAFYHRHNCRRVKGMPCIIPAIFDSTTGKPKQVLNCFDWLVVGVNHKFEDGEIIMNRAAALQFNADNIDLCYVDPQGREAKDTETYQIIECCLENKIYAENILPCEQKLTHIARQQNNELKIS